MGLFYTVTRAALKAFFCGCYRHTVTFESDISFQSGAIIAPNHTSFLDPPLVAISWPEEVYFFARASLFTNPLFGSLIRSLHATAVTAASKDFFRVAADLLQAKKTIVIFPEGTRSVNGALAELKNGVSLIAIKNNVPIVPAYIDGAVAAWPRNKKCPSFFGQRTSCTFGVPLFPDQITVESDHSKDVHATLTDKLQGALIRLQSQRRIP